MDKLTLQQRGALYATSANHRELVLMSLRCGCFHCLGAFPPKHIKEWTDDGQTALCPICHVDSVIPGHAHADVLQELRAHYFRAVEVPK